MPESKAPEPRVREPRVREPRVHLRESVIKALPDLRRTSRKKMHLPHSEFRI